MNLTSRRKTISIKLKRVSKNKRKYIHHQSTLVSTLCHLMAGQKSLVCILRVKNSKNESVIPVGFKLDEEKIPSCLTLLELSPQNLIEIQIDGHIEIPAMIVAKGDDSQDLLSSYSAFFRKEKRRLTRLSSKINNWINLNNILVTSITGSSLKAINQSDFDSFFKRVSILERRERSQSKRMSVTVSSSLSDNQENEDSCSTSKIQTRSEMKKEKQESETTSNYELSPDDVKLKMKIVDIKSALADFNSSLESLPEYDYYSTQFKHIGKMVNLIIDTFSSVKIPLSTGVEAINLDSNFPNSRVFKIPKDETRESGARTLVEGLLPVSTSKFKRALRTYSSKQEDREPTTILTFFVRYCFPTHWISDVTIRGSSGRKSLLTLWNYTDPLSNPVQGKFETGLGERRLRALITHIMRSCGRNSYDCSTEKLLVNSLSKALHYNRTKISSRIASSLEIPFGQPVYISESESDISEQEVIPVKKDRRTRKRSSSVEEEESSFTLDNLDQNKVLNSLEHKNSSAPTSSQSIPCYIAQPISEEPFQKRKKVKNATEKVADDQVHSDGVSENIETEASIQIPFTQSISYAASTATPVHMDETENTDADTEINDSGFENKNSNISTEEAENDQGDEALTSSIRSVEMTDEMSSVNEKNCESNYESDNQVESTKTDEASKIERERSGNRGSINDSNTKTQMELKESQSTKIPEARQHCDPKILELLQNNPGLLEAIVNYSKHDKQ